MDKILGYKLDVRNNHTPWFLPCTENGHIVELEFDNMFFPASSPEEMKQLLTKMFPNNQVHVEGTVLYLVASQQKDDIVGQARLLGTRSIMMSFIQEHYPDIAAVLHESHGKCCFSVESDLFIVRTTDHCYLLTKDPEAPIRFKRTVKRRTPKIVNKDTMERIQAYYFADALLTTIFGAWDGWRWDSAMRLKTWPGPSSLCAQVAARLDRLRKTVKKPKMSKALALQFQTIAKAHEWATGTKTSWGPLYVAADRLHRWITGKPLLSRSKMKFWKAKCEYCEKCHQPFVHQEICHGCYSS